MSNTTSDLKYSPDPGLQAALEMAIEMEIPLFITGEPGTGKTELAYWVAQNADYQAAYGISGEVLRFNVKTTSTAKDLLYRYDAIRHFRDSQREGGTVPNVLKYIHFEALGQAIIAARTQRRVVLVDEIDKAPRDFSNDLLFEFDKLAFRIEEATPAELREEKFPWGEMPSLKQLNIKKPAFDRQDFIYFADEEERRQKQVKKPVLILTSNSEKNLPDAFLRRCAFYHISFPEEGLLLHILKIKGLYDEMGNRKLTEDAVKFFLDLRQTAGLRRKPATAELIAWVELLHSKGVAPKQDLSADDIKTMLPTLSLLGKNKEDLDRIVSQLEKKKSPIA
jgi:MoxR-like ATPase